MPEASEFAAVATGLSPLEREVRTAAFRAIYRGETLTPAVLASRLAKPTPEVQAAAQLLVDRGLMTVDGGGSVTGSHGLSLSPSDHRVTFEAGIRFVWCAVDAVGIPAAMAVDATVTSRCFQCGEPVGLAIRGGEPQGPDADALSIGIGVAGSSGKVNEDLCPMINFFCSREHAEAWAASAGVAHIISIQQAAEVGQREWADVLD